MENWEKEEEREDMDKSFGQREQRIQSIAGTEGGVMGWGWIREGV